MSLPRHNALPSAGPTCWKAPRGVRVTDTTCPAPLQVEQVDGWVPLLMPLPVQVEQASKRLTSSSLLQGRRQ